MIRRPPRSTLDRSSAASDVYKRQEVYRVAGAYRRGVGRQGHRGWWHDVDRHICGVDPAIVAVQHHHLVGCLLYTSDAADERSSVDLGGRWIIKKKNSG